MDNIQKFYRIPAIFLVPERQLGGVKIKAIEAGWNGLPIVSTSAGLSGTGLVDKVSALVANNENDFVDAVERLLLSKKLREDIAASAFSHTRKIFNKENIDNEWRSVIGSIA